MSSTQLSDVIIPSIYADYTAVNGPEKTAYFESGVIVQNPMLDQSANAASTLFNLPFWKDLDASQEANASSDDPTVVATPQKVTADKQVARKAYLNQGYSSGDLVGELAGSEPMQQVRNRFGKYWERQFQRRLVATTQGILAANIAASSGDMVINVASQTLAGITTATKYSRANFVNATMTLGDRFDGIVAIGVHSHIYQQMVLNDEITFIPDSQGNMTIATYMGRRIIVDDGLPAVAGTTDAGAINYTSVLFGAGAFGYGEGQAKVPVEVYRRPDQGNGGGVEQLWERKTWLLHPFGHKWLDASVAGHSAVQAELKLATNWSRVVDRKNVPLAFVVTN
jgi:hypothetical protein